MSEKRPCPACGHTRSVTKVGLMSWHLGEERDWKGKPKPCAGEGKPPADSDREAAEETTL